MKMNKLAVAISLAGTLASGIAFAATQNITANVNFDTALTITKTNDISFGLVKALQAGTYTISAAGVVTPTAGGVVLGGTPTAASLSIVGSTTQLIDISTGNYQVNAGVTPSAATCKYNAGIEAACGTLTSQAAPGTGKTLLVGVQIAADGTQGAGSTAAPTFDVVVNYH